MENALQRNIPVIGRILLSFIFIFSGFGKITGFTGTAAYMASKGMPMVPLFLVGAICVEFIGGLLLLVGYRARLVATVFFLFLIPTTLIFHNFWAADAAHYQDQLINFMKNVSIMGGMLYVVAFGAGAHSLDSKSGRVEVAGRLAHLG